MQTEFSTLPPLLSVREVCELANVSRDFVYHSIDEGKLPAVRLSGRFIRVHRPDFFAWVGARRQEGTPHV